MGMGRLRCMDMGMHMDMDMGMDIDMHMDMCRQAGRQASNGGPCMTCFPQDMVSTGLKHDNMVFHMGDGL